MIGQGLSDEGRITPSGVQIQAMISFKLIAFLEKYFEGFLRPAPRPRPAVANANGVFFTGDHKRCRMGFSRKRVALQNGKNAFIHS